VRRIDLIKEEKMDLPKRGPGWNARNVACPRCGAPIGEDCKKMDRFSSHRERMDAGYALCGQSVELRGLMRKFALFDAPKQKKQTSHRSRAATNNCSAMTFQCSLKRHLECPKLSHAWCLCDCHKHPAAHGHGTPGGI